MDDGSTLKVATSMTSDWGLPQFDDPTAEHYCTVSTNGDATVEARFDPDGHTRPIKHAIIVDVFDDSLAPGDTITLTLGETSEGSLGIQTQTFPETDFVFIGFIDPFGTAEFVRLEDELSVDIVSGSATDFEAIAKARDEMVDVSVRAIDEWGNISRRYNSVADVESLSGEILASCDLENGIAHTSIETREVVSDEEPLRFTVSDDHFQATTNPVVPSNPIRWGDLHGQSEETVGTGSVEEYFDFARNAAFLDFVSHVGNDFQITDEFWERLQKIVESVNTPDEFVSFLGYEWSANTPNGGDHNIYFRDDSAEIVRSSHWQLDDETRYQGLKSASDLYDYYGGRDDVLIHPHLGGRPATLDNIDESLTPAFEISSVWGVFEWFATEAFEAGHHLGFVGGSDDHTGRPGASYPTNHPFFLVRGGLTGVPSESLTREELWNALQSSQCYATTGARIHLDVDIDGASMGECITVNGTSEIDVSIAGTAPLTNVDLFCDGECIDSVDCTTGADRYEIRWSGIRPQVRDKVVDWSGGLTLDTGSFIDVEPFGFQHPEHGLTSTAPMSLEWISKTAGNYQGLRFNAPTDATISLRTPMYSGSFAIDTISKERIRDFGPVKGEIVCREVGAATTTDTALTFTDDLDAGTHAYHVRVRQADGEIAWSSPISVTTDH
ncbi:DUF3604 domain-containing protein [Natrinema versiforme]|uniref:DUF3604 domain-containing protein n=1 Tax=Natrinema versiforme JCM 10478 TaxID=1227496 RepID=L9XN72_9EURY|nr:DUF3604 domain-containing protein [Natrinema versiforme]ELY62987.1 hypothetical protein C489_20786 [Natrinema versiforme JCM 10478]